MNQATPIINVLPLYEGTFSVGLDKEFNRINREDPPAKGALKISLNPFLIKSHERTILFDVGIGDFGEDTSTNTIKENLAEHNITEYDITDIFTSHLHYDHIGGLAGQSSGYWELTFPETNLWVSKKGWEKALAQEEHYDEEKTAFLHFLDARANLHFYEHTPQPYPEIKVKRIGGHTEFSYLLLYDNENKKYMIAGDVLATRGEVNRKFAAKYDFDPQKSMDVRVKLTQKAFEENYTVMGYHDSHHPLFNLTNYHKEKGYKIETPEDDFTA